MSNTKILGITTAVILITIILTSLIAFTVISSQINDSTDETYDSLLDLFKKTTDETIDDITTYLKITDKVGRYEGPAGNQKIQRIAIMIKPLISKEINISQITIKISNNEDIKILTYSNQPAKISQEHNQIFNHPTWNNLSINTFSIIATHDKDQSITKHSCFNENTDMGYIIIKLPPEHHMKKGDTINLEILPSTGINKKIILEAPLPMSNLVKL